MVVAINENLHDSQITIYIRKKSMQGIVLRPIDCQNIVLSVSPNQPCFILALPELMIMFMLNLFIYIEKKNT